MSDEPMRIINPTAPWPDGRGGIVNSAAHPFRDARGSITNLTEFPCGSVALIRSKANTVRSNHYHKRDAHYLFCLEGHWIYQECAIDEKLNDAEKVHVHVNELVYTPPMRLHRCSFITNTVLISMSRQTRTHAEHEADVVRVP
jgi:dTDP-4-dehydrorhamnose 3,5-epimerase-like enzyme